MISVAAFTFSLLFAFITFVVDISNIPVFTGFVVSSTISLVLSGKDIIIFWLSSASVWLFICVKTALEFLSRIFKTPSCPNISS